MKYVNKAERAVSASTQDTVSYIPRLDGLRFFAFTLVFANHFPGNKNAFLSLAHDHGWVGVHLFLVLSAFLLTKILKAEKAKTGTIAIARFYARRALRIWPLYFVFCISAAATSAIRGRWHDDYGLRLTGLLLFFDNILAGLDNFNGLAFTLHLWTVSLEEQFYLVLPWVLLLWIDDAPKLKKCLFAIWTAFIMARATLVFESARHPMIYTSIFSADSLLLGTLLGVTTTPRISGPKLILIWVLGLSLMFFEVWTPPKRILGLHQIFLYSLVAAGAGLVLIASQQAKWLGFLSSPLLRYLGKISFGLYMFHIFGISLSLFLAKKLSINNWLLQAASAFAFTLIPSLVSYELFEKRFLVLKRRFEQIHTRPI